MAKKLTINPEITQEQFRASNPQKSSWVSANAGSGKTYVLSQRVIRLMLAGNQPDKILCLTFTKAAAANMQNRVFETLGEWTMMDDNSLDEALVAQMGITPDEKVRFNARQLFAKALDSPGGLKIQTIHAFCESLLHQFPLEANVPGHFETIQELEQEELLARATSQVLGASDGTLVSEFEALAPYASDHAIEEGIEAIIKNRAKFKQFTKGNVDGAMDALYESFDIERSTTQEDIKTKYIENLPVGADVLKEICQLASTGKGASDKKLTDNLHIFLTSTDINQRFDALCNACLTKKGEPLSDRSIATKDIKTAMPDLVANIQVCGVTLVDALERINVPRLLQNTSHLFKIADGVLENYEAMKRKRGAIDFDDQIEKVAHLLNRADIRDWVRYKLDRGIDHLLVDEAQDTSPKQWEIINAISDDFYSGEAIEAKSRTVFVVGDEKQSIFSFQGADPKEFDAQERHLRKRVKDAQKDYHPGKLYFSFRSAEDILRAVDKVFEVPENLFGLTQSNEAPTHSAVRDKSPGDVQIWPLFRKKQQEQTDEWLDPIDHKSEEDPAALLADKITAHVKQWVGKPLPGSDTPLKFGDILVLVRKRDHFITALTRKMKDEGLAVAGTDRLNLTEHVAVEDMIAIGRTALLPQDDLSLAASLKSLFFNVDEETLFQLAYDRGDNTSLYDNIQSISDDSAHKYSQTAQKLLNALEEIFNYARTCSVFEFYAKLLGKLGGRKKLLSRLGHEAEDIIDTFLDEALNFSRGREGGLESFLAEVTRANPEIKREVDLNRDEVRILTVHGSKGLEAKVVFLVDPCGKPWLAKNLPKILSLPTPEERTIAPFIWLPSSKLHTKETKEEAQKAELAANAEYRRLLYVGMTRAEDRLVVCGYAGSREIKHDHWHKMVSDALKDDAKVMLDSNGNEMGLQWKYRDYDGDEPGKMAQTHVEPRREPERPSWLFEKAKRDIPLPRPLTPSGAYAIIQNDNQSVPIIHKGQNLTEQAFAIKKGNVTHKLLEVLPDFDVAERRIIAQKHIAKSCSKWPESLQEELINQVFSILENDDYSRFFDKQAQAEVSLSGWLETKHGKIQVVGQVDRLHISDDQVTILDFKTNQHVPMSPDQVPQEYCLQLALYRALLSSIYPNHKISTALLWTQLPSLMIIPNSQLDATIKTIN